jgi:hypothetical protein
MPYSLKAMRARFALSVVLLSLATAASAGPKEDVAAAASTWVGTRRAFSRLCGSGLKRRGQVRRWRISDLPERSGDVCFWG